MVYIYKTTTLTGKRMVDLKFHNTPKQFKSVRNFKYKNNFYKVYINKNDAVYDIYQSVVLTRKESGKPATWELIRDTNLLNKIIGNPYSIAMNKVITEIEKELL